MIKKKNLHREPHTIELNWERSDRGDETVWFLTGGLFSEYLQIYRPTPHSRYRIEFENIVIATEATLTEAKHRALAEMSVLLHQEKQIITIHRIYADRQRQCLTRWMEGKI